MEDLDPPREKQGAADDILRTLEAFGFEWDGELLYQSRRIEAYRAALDRLESGGHAFRCICSRREIAAAGLQGPEGPRYPGTCRERRIGPGSTPQAVRLHTRQITEAFTDRICGRIRQDLENEIGDFVIRRADGLFAYQLAVVIDDAEQNITHVVRGADLLLSTPRQIHLQHLLGLPTPDYAHLPLVLDDHGRKLSKQDRAHPVSKKAPLPALTNAFRFLNQPLSEELPGNLREFWQWATENWTLRRVPVTQGAPRAIPLK
jgi:glutamyl-Q tRNA(Asp) synthetase